MLWQPVLTLTGTYGLILALTWLLHIRMRHGWRVAFIVSLTILGTVLWAVTETLSAFRLVGMPQLSAAWGILWLAVASTCAWTLLTRRRGREALPRTTVLDRLRAMPAQQLVIVGFVILVLIALATVALAAAPNTWDSLTYHLSRVMHWEQNGTLHFYSTAIQRQLTSGPLAEMAILTLQVLAGGDQLANLVQFTAMLGCVVGATLIAAILGGGTPAQLLAGLATLTLPMGVLQATSTQTDYAAALWCVCFIVLSDRQVATVCRTAGPFLAGAALGLALITKLTAAVFLAPFLVWRVLGLLDALRWRAGKPVALAIVTAALIAAPHTWRNISTYGNPVGITEGPEQAYIVNASLDPATIFSNAIRNFGSQLGTPSTAWNRGVEAAVSLLHRAAGIDVNDPRTTWPGAEYQVLAERHEDSEGNPLHVVLLLVATGLSIVRRARRKNTYIICVIAGFLLFSSIFRWQPWGSRLLLPLFVLAMPFEATVLEVHLRGKLILLPAALLGLAALPYVVANPARPILGANNVFMTDRLHQYFVNVPDNIAAYEDAASGIRDAQCSEVGMVTRYDGREYLAWVMVHQQVPRARLEHVLVQNPSSRYADASFSPCAIIVMKGLPTVTLRFRGSIYNKVLATDTLDLFLVGQGP